jgi:hypothetical protein
MRPMTPEPRRGPAGDANTEPADPSALVTVTASERPDLWEATSSTFRDVWPEYNTHGNESGEYFGALVPRFADFQLLLVDPSTDQVVARGRTIPFRWHGTLEDLPDGIDALGLRALHDPAPPTALSALSAEVLPTLQGRDLSRQVLLRMAEVARRAGLAPLVAPVRPNWKERYPLIAIERYASWRRGDGLPFDPWLRVHARLGGRILRPAPRSMRIEAPARDWEEWTGMPFPDDGDYVFPFGLAPLEVRAGTGRYWEPNVWVLHEV